MASLDASKAFDRVNHFKLFNILINKGVPMCFVSLISNWYLKLHAVVKLNGVLSDMFSVKSGIVQGGILSPVLFNIYIDEMITNLRNSDLGCQYKGCYIGCIVYADDIILLSSSVMELQNMLDVCTNVGVQLGIAFNPVKSKCICIGPNRHLIPSDMTLSSGTIAWADKIKYLGIWICAGKKFTIDLSECRRKFCTCVNSILNKAKLTSDLLKLQLMESYCLPILTYAIECFNLNMTDLAQINYWWNSVYRKIFCYNKWESVRLLICKLQRLDFINIFYLRKFSFVNNLTNDMYTDHSKIMKHFALHYINENEYMCMLNMNSCNSDWSMGRIRAAIYCNFELSTVSSSTSV